MRPIALTTTSVLLALSVGGCKIIKTEPAAATDGTAAASPLDQLVADTFESRLLPLISAQALEVAALRVAIATDFDATGEAHGHRGAGAGAAWNFAVEGSGTVISANLTSRARRVEIDTDADGQADVSVQIGPVINGTSLRDIAPFYDFGDFRDQIEFARLARALNDRVTATLSVPEADLAGRGARFTGVLALNNATSPFVVTAVSFEVAP